MNGERVHQVYGTTIEGYIKGLCEELAFDGVSSYSIWSAARYGFRLSNLEIEAFALHAIEALLDAGAVPSKPSALGPDYFLPEEGYKGEPKEVAIRIVNEWKALESDPDHAWHWFYAFDGP
jgi:hypothetical protein